VYDPTYKAFYDERRAETYAHDYENLRAEDSEYYGILRRFIREHSLEDKRCLEIGSSGGMFQDMVRDYHGTDIAATLARYYHKPYTVADGTRYPFPDESFDAIWTFTVYEHIPHLQEALLEIVRLLKPGGVVLFQPAWQCRPWKSQGYDVRPFRDFGIGGKLIKASIPLRNSVAWRSLFVVPKRLIRQVRFLLGHRYTRIRYKPLTPNYDRYWSADSDACNHIDPHDAILWFESHGLECLSHPVHLRALSVRTGALVFKKTEVGSRRGVG